MLTAKLIGNIWATKKADALNGFKLMLVEVIGGKDEGKRLAAVDTIGAGIGDKVLVCTGSSARRMAGSDTCPVDAAIVGIIDEDCNFDHA
jgi:ethanolamine utilization protein EutN